MHREAEYPQSQLHPLAEVHTLSTDLGLTTSNIKLLKLINNSFKKVQMIIIQVAKGKFSPLYKDI